MNNQLGTITIKNTRFIVNITDNAKQSIKLDGYPIIGSILSLGETIETLADGTHMLIDKTSDQSIVFDKTVNTLTVTSMFPNHHIHTID